jgi:hypothetical protein
MGYYIRVFGLRDKDIAFEELNNQIIKKGFEVKFAIEEGNINKWKQIYIEFDDEHPIATIEKSIREDEIFLEELKEFIEEVIEYKPMSAAKWLQRYLPKTKVIYAIRVFTAGTEMMPGWEIIHTIQRHLQCRVGGIIQADLEGFSNEEGYHILWQFYNVNAAV